MLHFSKAVESIKIVHDLFIEEIQISERLWN